MNDNRDLVALMYAETENAPPSRIDIGRALTEGNAVGVVVRLRRLLPHWSSSSLLSWA